MSAKHTWRELCQQVSQSPPILFMPSGGMGTRLQPLPYKNEAALVDDIPFTEFIIATAVKYLGIKEVIFGIDGKKRNHYSRTQYYYGNGIEFSHTWQVTDQPAGFIYQPRYFLDYGNADSAYRNLKHIRQLLPQTAHKPTLVLQNDTLIHPEDIANLYLQTLNSKPLMGIALRHVEEPWHYGVATLDANNLITTFQEKPKPTSDLSTLVSTGAYVLEPGAYQYLEGDFGEQVVPKLVQLQSACGFVCKHPMYDFGNVDNVLPNTLHLLSNPPDYFLELLKLHCEIITVGKTRVYLRNGNKYEEQLKKNTLKKIHDGSLTVTGDFVYLGHIEMPNVKNSHIILENSAIGSGSRLWPGVQIYNSNIFNGWDIRQTVRIQNSLLGRAGTVGSRSQITNSILGGDNRITANQTINNQKIKLGQKIPLTQTA